MWEGADFIDTQVTTSKQDEAIQDIEDDLQRELVFYNQVNTVEYHGQMLCLHSAQMIRLVGENWEGPCSASKSMVPGLLRKVISVMVSSPSC